MRKIALILLGMICCLSLTAGGWDHPSRATQPAVLSIDHASSDVWLCERACNSDLNLPRAAGEVSSSPVTSLSLRYGASELSRAAFRFASQARSAGMLQAGSAFRFSDPFAGSHPVDYYVFRLRRLLI